MRTTVDLSPDLLHAAKARAAAAGESLKELFTRAVAREVGLPASRPHHTRVALPLVGRVGSGPAVDLTNADLAAALAAEDAETYVGR